MITRRQLLTAASLLSVAPSAVGKPILDIQSFGARGDGQSDDTDAIQHAINAACSAGGGTVRIPRRNLGQGEYWRLSRPLLLKSRVSLVGEGPESLLYNDRRESAVFMDQAVVLPGNYHPQFLNNLTFDQLTISEDRAIAFVDNIKARYSAGQTVFVRSADFDVSRAEFSISSITVICQVVRAETDRVHLDRSIHFDGPLVIAPSDNEIYWRALGPPTHCFVSIGSSIHNLAIRSHGFWIGDSAARGSEFSQLWIDAKVAVYGNLFQECSWKTIRARFDRLAIELSCNSTNVRVTDLVAEISQSSSEPNHQIIAIQESSQNCSVSNFSINASAFDKTGAVVRFGPSSYCSIMDGQISCEGARGAIVSFDTGASSVRHNSIRNVSFASSSARAGIIFEARDPGIVANNDVVNVSILGLTDAVAARLGGQYNTIDRCHLTGRSLAILRQAVGCSVRDSSVPTRIENHSAEPTTITLLRNRPIP